MALRVKRQKEQQVQPLGAKDKDVECSGSAADMGLINRNNELEILTSNLKRMLDVSRRRERKLVKVLEEVSKEKLLNLDLDDCFAEDISISSESAQSFVRSLTDRTLWLIGLLVFQSLSSFILRSNEDLLQKFPTIVYFLTMLVGAGGNAGNQATVRVIRGLALGSLTVEKSGWYILKEISASLIIGVIVGIAGLLRVYYFSSVAFYESVAISIALVTIVISSIVIGTVLPLVFQIFGVDPAHASTTIQVVMDISGVLITCYLTAYLLGDDSNSLNSTGAIDATASNGISGSIVDTAVKAILPTLKPSTVPIAS